MNTLLKERGLSGFIAKKVTMSRVVHDGKIIGATLLWVPPMTVIAKKYYDGKCFAQVGVQINKNISKPQKAELEKLGLPMMDVRKEFLCDESVNVGDTIDPGRVFSEGESFKATARTIGRGFTGPMKRWNFAGLPASHGASKSHRSHGSTGQRTLPGRVFKGKKMAGHYGNENVSVSVEILDYDPKTSILSVFSSVPGKAGLVVFNNPAF